jgi:3-oxoacyl-[acyl-carrier protein] reductase
MDLGLKGMKAVLAAASKGIGRATAEALAAEGCDVAICARGQAAVDATVAALKAYGVSVFGDSIDVTDAAAYRAWVGDAAGRLGGCDIFISFASAKGGPASEENWQKVFNLDLLATYRGVEAALPYLEKSKSGSVVAVASTAALEEFFGPQSYNAMKAAVINYASALSQAFAAKGIRVNTVSPGPTWVDGGDWEMIKTHMRPIYDQTINAVPMGRLGTSAEVAKAIVFVASPACPFMTGANLVIDGGFTKRVQY